MGDRPLIDSLANYRQTKAVTLRAKVNWYQLVSTVEKLRLPIVPQWTTYGAL